MISEVQVPNTIKPPKKVRLDITLADTHVARLDELCGLELRTRSAQLGYMIENWDSRATGGGCKAPATVNPVNAQTAPSAEDKRPVGRPPVTSTKPKAKPRSPVVFLHNYDELVHMPEHEWLGSPWIVRTLINPEGTGWYAWTESWPVCERDPDHPCGSKPPHAWAAVERSFKSHAQNIACMVGWGPDTPAHFREDTNGYMTMYMKHELAGTPFESDEEAFAWIWEQMQAGKVTEMMVMPGKRP